MDKLNQLMGEDMPRLLAHEAIHLVLLVDSLWDDYTRSWEKTLTPAHRRFKKDLAEAVGSSREGEPNEMWNRYGIWTRSNSDRGDNIRRRHQYYAEYMLQELGGLTPLDPKRQFGTLEREHVYLRDRQTCWVCEAPVAWSEAEIHHVIEHSRGGPTDVGNGALVHAKCHPKSKAATEELAQKFAAARG